MRGFRGPSGRVLTSARRFLAASCPYVVAHDIRSVRSLPSPSGPGCRWEPTQIAIFTCLHSLMSACPHALPASFPVSASTPRHLSSPQPCRTHSPDATCSGVAAPGPARPMPSCFRWSPGCPMTARLVPKHHERSSSRPRASWPTRSTRPWHHWRRLPGSPHRRSSVASARTRRWPRFAEASTSSWPARDGWRT